MSDFKDVVILLPGITGSVLANEEGKEVWSLSAGSMWRSLVSLGGSIADLELAAPDDPGGVTAPRLIPDVSIVPGFMKIDGYTGLENYLVNKLNLKKGKNYFSFPYDWRLDNRFNAHLLEKKAMYWLKQWRNSSGATDARLVLVGHSMGGLVSRYFLECLGGWQHTRSLITLGTPHLGSLNAVDNLVNGLKLGPMGLDGLTSVLRSLPSVYQLLPIYRCADTGEERLQKITDVALAGKLPHVDPKRVADARHFHQEIEDAQKDNSNNLVYQNQGYKMIPLVGIEQPTFQSVRCENNKVELLRSLDGVDDTGDGTVPRIAATPIELINKNREIFAANKHGSLQNDNGSQINLNGILTQAEIDIGQMLRDELPTALSLDLHDLILKDEPLQVRARATEGNPKILVEITKIESGESFQGKLDRIPNDDWRSAEFDLEPGTWRVSVSADDATPVTDIVLVADGN